MKQIFELELYGKKMTFETGRIAKQANTQGTFWGETQLSGITSSLVIPSATAVRNDVDVDYFIVASVAASSIWASSTLAVAAPCWSTTMVTIPPNCWPPSVPLAPAGPTSGWC